MQRALVTVLFLLAGCGGDSSTRFCFGSDEFCDDVFARNRTPVADAGPDLHAAAGDTVDLDGSASSDQDGNIAEYAWAQASGPPVAIAGATRAVASFTVPGVSTDTELTFRLTVTDDDGASATDHIRVTAVPGLSAAAHTGLTVLKTRYPPAPAWGTGECCGSGRFVGAWLGARVLAYQGGLDDDVEGLLDQLRVMEISLAAAPGATGAETAAGAVLFRLGQRAVACFTASRDPATADLARRTGSLSGTLERDHWLDAAARAFPELAPRGKDPLITAEHLLRSDAAARNLAPDVLAAATLVLTATLAPPMICP